MLQLAFQIVEKIAWSPMIVRQNLCKSFAEAVLDEYTEEYDTSVLPSCLPHLSDDHELNNCTSFFKGIQMLRAFGCKSPIYAPDDGEVGFLREYESLTMSPKIKYVSVFVSVPVSEKDCDVPDDGEAESS